MDNAQLLATTIANKTIGYFGKYMNLAATVARDWDYEPATEGESVKIGKRGALTANTKTATGDVTLQSPTATGVTVTLDTHKEVTIDLTDVTKAKQAKKLDIMEGYAKDAAAVMLEAVEDALAALYASLTATVVVFYATSITTKKTSLLNLRKAFTVAKVPKS